MLRRRFDLFTLTYLTSTVYFLPAFFGITHDGTLPLILNPITLSQHLFYFYYFMLLLSFAWLFTKTNTELVKKQHWHSQEQPTSQIKILTSMSRVSSVLTPLLLFLAWTVMGQSLFSAEKKDTLENFSVFYALFETTSLIYFFTSFICKRRIHIIISLLLMAFDMYVGFRTIGAFAFILAFAYFLFSNSSPKNMLIFAGSLILAYTFASLYKIISVFFKLGEVATGYLALLDLNNVIEYLLITESFVTQEVFRKTISSDFVLPPEYPLSLIRIFLPGVNNILFGKGLGFNDYYQDKLFAHIPWGLGSNVWAEQYAIWGWSGPVILVLSMFCLLYYANKKIFKWYRSGKIHRVALTLYLVGPFYFYIHRNDILFQLNITRNLVVVWLLIFILVKYVFPELKKYIFHRT